MKEVENLLQKGPILDKNDTLPHIRNLINKFSVYELPVTEGLRLLGTVSIRKIVNFLKNTKTENILAQNLVEKNFIRVRIDSEIKEIVENFLKTKKFIACFVSEDILYGYLQRLKLLNFLLQTKESVSGLISSDFVSVQFDDGIEKLIKAVKKEKNVVVFKNEIIINAFSPEELYSLLFIGNYIKKVEKDFETLRSDEKRFLKFRRRQQLINYLKKNYSFISIPKLRIGEILKEGKIISKEERIGNVARIMLEINKSVLPLGEGIITDLDLLRYYYEG
ncbi:MAG: hypothetical protein QXX38_00080 [Candidatus Aenigmatarchaeota archaeon]